MPSQSPFAVALAAFLNMFAVGTVYALSTLQKELPRLFQHIPASLAQAPFAAACLGLSFGTAASASLITAWGSHAVTAAGTALWGAALLGTDYFLEQFSVAGVLASLVLGGVGVGFTYLAVIVMVGQGLPHQPLARSAIGPLGFSSGSAAVVALSAFLQFQAQDTQQLGQFLVVGGVVSIVIALVTLATLPSNAAPVQSAPVQRAPVQNITVSRDPPEMALSILLFFNAFPGMAAFAALAPAAASYGTGGDSTFYALAGSMIALTLGGLLAPSLYARLGAKPTFVSLFSLRGLVLTLMSRTSSSPSGALLALVVVLFAHGAGFSVLPILVKTKYPDATHFYTVYARILPAWGAAGIAAVVFNSALLAATGRIESGYLYLGLLTASVSTALTVLPPDLSGPLKKKEK